MTEKQLKIVLLVNCIITILLLSIYEDGFSIPTKLTLWQTTIFPILFFCLIYQYIKWAHFLKNIDEYDK